MNIKFGNLKEKDVIDLNKGKNLGRIDDIVFDEESNIKEFIILGESKAFGLKKGENKYIDFSSVELIGDDVILVRYDNETRKQEVKSDYIYSPKIFKKVDKTI